MKPQIRDILTISDAKVNGKGNQAFVRWDEHVYIHNLFIYTEGNQKKIRENDRKLDLTKYCIIFFDINEDLLVYTKHWNSALQHRFRTLKSFTTFIIDIVNVIEQNIMDKYVIYNNPKIGISSLGNKVETYKSLSCMSNPSIHIPSFQCFENFMETKSWKCTFPVVLKEICNSNGECIQIDTPIEVLQWISSREHKNYFMSSFISSYNPTYDLYINVRVLSIDDEMLGFFVKCSKTWNIHNDIDETNYFKVNQYVRDNINITDLHTYVRYVFHTFGHGIYVHDFVFTPEHYLYLCEIGYKYNIDSFEYTTSIQAHLHQLSLDNSHTLQQKYYTFMNFKKQSLNQI